MRAQHTHRGHCQVCGSLQAARHNDTNALPNVLALHGYAVQWGQFNGTCHGSKRLPMEIERTLTDETIARALAWALERDELCGSYHTGRITPERVRTGRMVQNERREYVAETIAWADAGAELRRRAVSERCAELKAEAARARRHASDLGRLVDAKHGQPLVEAQRKPKAEPITVGMVFSIYGREWRVRALVRRGMGRGDAPNHAVCERTDGETWSEERMREERARSGMGVPIEHRPLTISFRTLRGRQKHL